MIVRIAAASGRGDIAMAAVFCMLGAAGSLALGQDANWDLQNYHLYNAWAVLQGGRFGIDGHPAGEPTFFNPALDVLLYPLLMGLPDRVCGALLGAVHGLAAYLVYLLGLEVFGRERSGRLLAAVAALAGATSAMALSELATTFHDLTTAIPILAALLIVVRSPRGDSIPRLAFAGALIGIAVGVKLTNAPYALGLMAALAFSHARRPRAIAAFLGCAGIALIAGHGWWAWTLDAHFASPMFPFANTIFKSPYFPEVDLSHQRFFARSVMEWIFYPFYFATSHRTAEVAFRDFRLAAAYLAVVAIAAAGVLHRLRSGPAPGSSLPGGSAQVVGFVVASYVPWLLVFSTQRYATALELLSVLVVFIALGLTRSRRLQVILAMVVAVALVAATRPADWKRVPWDGNRYSEAWNLDPALRGAAAILGNRPLAFLAPTSGFSETAWIGETFTPADRARTERFIGSRPIFVLAFGWLEREEAQRVMREMGLGITAPCSKFSTKIAGPVLMCPAARGATFDPSRFANLTERWSFEARPTKGELRLRRGQEAWLEVELRNTGPDPLWSAVPDTMRLARLPAREDPVGEINLSYHLLSESGEMVAFDGVRTPLPRSLQPGQSLSLLLRVAAPAMAGRYRIQPDLVMEGVRWAQGGMRGPTILLTVD